VASRYTHAASVGGDVTITSDYLFRGISLSDGRAAAQIDLHATSMGGTFAGVFGSTLNADDEPGSRYELEAYVGQRFDLSPSWTTTLTAVNYSYLHGSQPMSNDYQELAAAVSYLDSWTLSVAVSPNGVRYSQGMRLGRYPSYVIDASAQRTVVGRLSATGAIGYYALTGPAGAGYAYGNVGLAYEYKAWRLDGGYYFTEAHARDVLPYQRVENRVAATLSWHF
jgi:uncharacterized protein (TIGR02001 family)